MSNASPQILEKKLGMGGVYAVATGATLSAGFFLLPGLAFREAGPAMVLAYLIAAIPLIPAMFSIVELSTAMPRAGGVYYFMDRSMGPLVGTIGGIGTWLALILKVAFALVGMGAYIQIFLGADVPLTIMSVGIALALGLLNLFSAEKASGLQIFLVAGLLAAITYFIGHGAAHVEPTRFNDFLGEGWDHIIGTAGMVYISYVGVTKVASLSEEVRDPERNLPRGVFLSLATAVVVYLLGTLVMVGTLDADTLAASITPVADAAFAIAGEPGRIILTIAALMAFISVANAGLLSASRYPLAMSRDQILPAGFQKLNRRGIPAMAVIVTVLVIVLILVAFDATRIAKLASAFQLLMFGFVCFAVIVMRESRLDSYDPGYRSPGYPYMQIFGMFAPVVLIVQMGLMPSLFAFGLVAAGALWYRHVAGKRKLERSGAVFHVFERLGRLRHDGLDTELREILKEKGLRQADPFDEIVTRSLVVDFAAECDFEDVVERAAPWVARHLGIDAETVRSEILKGTRIGHTPVARRVALPHFRSERVQHPELVLARGRKGIKLKYVPPGTNDETETVVDAVIFLVSPKTNPTQHLRILAQIARHVEDRHFKRDWFNAIDEQELREVLLREERWISLFVHEGAKTERMIGRSLAEIGLPEGTLVAMLQRGGEVRIPRGGTVLESGDRLTIIGEPDAIEATYQQYFGAHEDSRGTDAASAAEHPSTEPPLPSEPQ